MSLIYQLQQLQGMAKQMEDATRRQQLDFTQIVNDLVSWRQECRLSEDYASADRIRAILDGVGIVITQGAAGLPLEQCGNKLYNDRWRQKD
jgi:cysteinyl-tRNA synthetase